MEKIKELTPEQEARFDEFRDRWLAIGLSTERVDFEIAKKAVEKSYICGGIEPPLNYYFAKSPMDAWRIYKEICPEKPDHSEFLSSFISGNHEASWLSFYSYFKEVVGVEGLEILDGLFELAEVSGWVAAFDVAAIIVDRPQIIMFDENNRMHNEVGAAIRYVDGYSIYGWHGVTVPAEFIEERHTMKAEVALGQDNLELRRCACEIIGWTKIINELDAKVIDKDEDPEVGELLTINIPDIGRENFLRVMCGTGREFAIPVPPEMKTALEANAWTYGLDPWEYKPEVRT